MTAGAEVGGERRSGVASSFRAAEDEDMVFAYQLHVVKRKGWRGESHRRDCYIVRRQMLGRMEV